MSSDLVTLCKDEIDKNIDKYKNYYTEYSNIVSKNNSVV